LHNVAQDMVRERYINKTPVLLSIYDYYIRPCHVNSRSALTFNR